MLATSKIFPTLPASDLSRAGSFYEKTLGLKKTDEGQPDDGLMFEVGDSSRVLVYKTEARPAEATAAFFVVDDLTREMSDLKERGVSFEEYDLPDLKTREGVWEEGEAKAAWFKDTEGNILSLTQLPKK